jgi:acetolactate synthase-1/2/3 large subunit
MNAELPWLARALVDAGCRHAFGVTGSGPSLELITRIEEAGAAFHTTGHEAAAAMMAGAVAACSGRPSLAISIKGPGLANLLPGIVLSSYENWPLLTVSEAYSPSISPFRKHKRLDHVRLLAPCVKAVAGMDRIRQDLPELLEIARREAPGPVHLNLCPGDPGPLAKTASPVPPGQEDPAPIIDRSRRPVVIAGSLSLRRSWGSRLGRLGVPVFTTASAKGVVDECSPQAAGVYTGDGKELAPESTLLAQADLVDGLGLRNTEVLTPRSLGPASLLLDEGDLALSEGFEATRQFVPCTEAAFEAALDALSGRSWGEDRVSAAITRLRGAVLQEAWSPAVVFAHLEQAVADCTLVSDTGLFCTAAEHLWRAGPRRRYGGSSNGRFMGAGLPTALGTALGVPGKPVYCVLGDGGVAAYPAEFRLAVAQRLPLCVLFMKDGGFGSISCVPQSFVPSPRALVVPDGSWGRTFEAMGCESHRVRDVRELELRHSGWARKAPLFLECEFDPSTYSRSTRGLR